MKHVFKTLATAGNAIVQAAITALHQMQSREGKADRVRGGHTVMTCRADSARQLGKKLREDHERLKRKRWFSGRDAKRDPRRGGYYLNDAYRAKAARRALRWHRNDVFKGIFYPEPPRHIREKKAYL